jgi:dTDP-4-amino-4,6-dideoxygalactose transaminase
VAERLRLLELEQKLPYIHNRVGWNYRMTEMQSVIGLCELKRVDTWNMPRRRRNAKVLLQALKDVPQVRYLPVDTPARRNGWYVFPITLDIDRMRCDIRQFVDALGAEGAPCWRVFWPQCHTEKAFQEHRGVGRSDFPFKSREYTDPASVDYTKVNVPNAVWHERRTFVTFIFPTYAEKNMHEIAAAIRKVIAAYAK